MKKSRWIIVGLSLAAIAQTTVLAGEYLSSVWPLKYGQAIEIRTVPIDPRSLFRGNYVRLQYDISRLPVTLSDQEIRTGQRVYVSLKRGEDGYFKAAKIHTQEPDSGVFIRGRNIKPRWRNSNTYEIKYGIEAYFMPKAKALETERIARTGNAAVTIYLQDNGKAALDSLRCIDCEKKGVTDNL